MVGERVVGDMVVRAGGEGAIVAVVTVDGANVLGADVVRERVVEGRVT